MNEVSFDWKHFPNLGFITSRLSNDVIQPIKNEIDIIRQNFQNLPKFNYNLAGNIEREYELLYSRDYIEQILMPFTVEYDKIFNYSSKLKYGLERKPLYLSNAWVNFQCKNEYNPVHDHDGVFSFVIWIQIPYTLEDEKKSPGFDSNSPAAGQFEFVHTDVLGEIKMVRIRCEKSEENTFMLFPSKLKHTVYPFFSSDDYRITVSGNFSFKG